MSFSRVVIALAATAFAVLASAAPDSPQHGNVLYRYTNEHGVQVIDDVVPPRYVSNGYEVISPTGRVIRVVAAQLTEAERAEKAEREAQLNADLQLLRRYSSVDDIESARKRKLAKVERDLALARSNITSLKSQIQREESAAARTERNGGEISQELLSRIDNLREEVKVMQERLLLREQEAVQINAEFDRHKVRFTEISGK